MQTCNVAIQQYKAMAERSPKQWPVEACLKGTQTQQVLE